MSDEEWGVSSDEEPETTNPTVHKKRLTVFAVDVHENMFVKRDDGTSPFSDCIEAFYQIVDSLIFSTSGTTVDTIALMFFEDDAKKAVMVKFDDHLLDAYEKLKKLKQKDYDLRTEFVRSGDVDFAMFLLHCNKIFAEIKKEDVWKRIVLITNDDDPVNGDAQKKFRALNEIQKLRDFGIVVSLVVMKNEFSFGTFYKEAGLEAACCLDLDGLSEKLSDFLVPEENKRTSYLYPFLGDTERHLKVTVRNFLKTPRLGCPKRVTRDKHVSVIKKKVETFENPDQKHELPVSALEDPLLFTREEAALFHPHNEFIGYFLICISDRLSTVGLEIGKPEVMQSHPLEPVPHFDTFWKYCASKRKVLICKKILNRTRSIPTLVEMIPKNVNNIHTFLIRPLASAENWSFVMNACNVSKPPISEKRLVSARTMVDSLTIGNFDLALLVEPTFEKRKAYMRSQILNEEMRNLCLNPISDEEIDEKLGELAVACASGEQKRGGTEKKQVAAKKPRV